MAKVKYYYDPETLSYRPIQSGKTLKISNFFLFLISSFLFGLFYAIRAFNHRFFKHAKGAFASNVRLQNYEFQFDLLGQRLSKWSK